jgi:molybdopterin molybdotransferase
VIHHPTEAIQAILNSLKPKGVVTISVEKSIGFVLANDVKAPMHSPAFDNSAMDGYAFRFSDWESINPLNISGTSSAGKPYSDRLKKLQAIRIYTGAAIPLGADTVVMQEKTNIHQNTLLITDLVLKKGGNIRLAGSEIRKGKIALEKGSILNPSACAFLASIGITQVKVHAKPSVAVIVTGNELVKNGKSLKPGQIHESNSVALQLALQMEGINNISVSHVRDNSEAMHRSFQKAVAKHDVIIFTGGISVGDYDFTEDVFAKNRVKKVFYKLKQKPGKPIYFGTTKGKAVFGLPGNPASVMTCFYLYVIPALRSLQNHPDKELPKIHMPLSHGFVRKPGMTAYLKAHTDLKSVQILEGQESYIMRSFAHANALVMLEPEKAEVKKGAIVETILLP